MICHSYEDFFKNFANKTKFRIIMRLNQRPMSVNELAEKLGEEQSKISHNLKNLAKCSILNVKQEGKKRIYAVNKETVMPILGLAGKHVKKHCGGRCHQ